MFVFGNRVFLHETPADGGGGGVAQAAPAQGTPENTNGDFWAMFPDVPEEHRPLLEPHIKSMQGHVTKLEQQYAPFKSFTESGLDPETAQGLVQFSADFDRDPRGMWLRMGTMLQEQGVIPDDLDLEHLSALANGEDVSGEEPGAVGVPADGADNPLMPVVQQLQQQVQELMQSRQQEQTQRQQVIQDQLLERRMSGMREALVKSGYPEELLTEELLTASIIAHKGNIQAATKNLTDTRSGLLKGFVQTRQEPSDLNMPNGVPGTLQTNKPKDSWGKARQGAENFLSRQNRSAAQE